MDSNLALVKIQDILWSTKNLETTHDMRVDEIKTVLMILQGDSYKRGKLDGIKLSESVLLDLHKKIHNQE